MLSEGAQELHALIASLTRADVSGVKVFTVAGGQVEVNDRGGVIEATEDGTVVVRNPYLSAEREPMERVTYYAMEHVVGVTFNRARA